MNVLYADGGGEERRRTGGGSTSESLERDGRAASTIHATTTTTTRRALEQDVAGVRIAHCSWCLAECAHAQVSEGFLLFRAAYRCGACARRTVPCRAPGCDAHARGANGSTAPRDDDLCLVHRAIIPAWPGLGGSDAGYDAWTKDRLAPKARCSWCLDVCRHALEHVDSFAPAVSSTSPASASSSSNGRSIVGAESFSCGGCARRTVRCETCERSIADGDAGAEENYAFAKAGDARCARCLGVVYDWNAPRDVNAALTRTEPAWCGWCGELCAHLVRDKARAKCQCLVCGGGTAPCERCPGSMRTRERPVVSRNVSSRVRGSASRPSTTGTCLRCEVMHATPSDDEARAVWDTVVARRAAADAASVRVRDVLARKTRWSRAAHDAGAWRPFALLATLPPRERVRIAARLGIRLCRERGYLDPHAEAWRVLATRGKGILARADAGGGGGGGGGGGALEGFGRRVSAEGRAVDDDDAASAERTIGSVLRRIGRDISRAAGVVPAGVVPGRRRANWLEALASVLVAGAETGRCPALDPREAASLPVVTTGRKGAARILRTPRALVVARYEECVLGMVAGAQRARLSPVQRLAIDSLAAHPTRVVLETRLKRSGADYRRIADAAVLAAFAASPWANAPGGFGDEDEPGRSLSDRAESIAADVYGCLLDGRAPTGPGRLGASARGGWPAGNGLETIQKRSGNVDVVDEVWSGVAPSLLASLACQTVAVTGGPTGVALGTAAALGVAGAKPLPGASFEDVTDFFAGVRAPSRVPEGAAGLFEPIAVLLVHGALLASRGVHVDDYHPGREERERAGARGGGGDPFAERRGRRGERPRGGSRASSSGEKPPRYAESGDSLMSDSPVGVIGGLGGSSRVSDGGSDRGRVGAWADEQARAPPGPRSALSGSEMTFEEETEEEEERVAEEEREEPVEPPSPVPRHFSRVGPFARVFGEDRAAAAEAEALPTSTRPGEEEGAGAPRARSTGSRATGPAASTTFPTSTLTGNASRFESARANAEIDDWLEDEI